MPLWSCRAVLKAAFEGRDSDKVHFSQDFDTPPSQMLDAACRMGLEGMMAKRRDSTYASAG